MGEANRLKVKDFDPAKVVPAYLRAFQEVLGAREARKHNCEHLDR
jgi:hypothetical protein